MPHDENSALASVPLDLLNCLQEDSEGRVERKKGLSSESFILSLLLFFLFSAADGPARAGVGGREMLVGREEEGEIYFWQSLHLRSVLGTPPPFLSRKKSFFPSLLPSPFSPFLLPLLFRVSL